MSKIELIRQAIDKAINHQSKMDEIAWSVPALSSLKIRHLMNNLGAISTRYFECGVHVGGLFSSVIRNNCNLLSATANDSFASDETGEIKYEPQFHANAQKCICSNTEFKMLKGDTFDFKPEDILGPIDLYLFDANHSYEAQRRAMSHFIDSMAEECIICVDDYDWEKVSKGTRNGLSDAGVDILFEDIWVGNDHDNNGAWNGFFVALVKKGDNFLMKTTQEEWDFYNKCIDGLPTRVGFSGNFLDKNGHEIPFGTGPHNIKYFKEAIEIVKPKSILEIGLCLGAGSSLFLNLFDGFVFSIDISDREETFEAGKILQLKYPNRFAFTCNGAKSSIDFMKQYTWDMIFIDGGHDEESVTEDIKLAKAFKIPYLLFDDVFERFGPGVLPAIEKFPELELVKDMNNLRLYKWASV